jgi:hypothetical protein
MRTAVRLHTIIAPGTIKNDEAAEDQGMPIREPAGKACRTLGRRPDRGEDEGLPMGEAPAGSANRIRGMDRG